MIESYESLYRKFLKEVRAQNKGISGRNDTIISLRKQIESQSLELTQLREYVAELVNINENYDIVNPNDYSVPIDYLKRGQKLLTKSGTNGK